MAVAVLSFLGAGAMLIVSNVTEAAESTKLKRDVAVINRSIRVYLLNGGTFLSSDLQDPRALLSKLKTRANDRSAKQLAGLRNSMADERLNFEMQSPGEANSTAERARFVADPANPRFVIEKAGEPGIRRFFLDASLAGKDYGTEDRAVNMNLAKTNPWVWDYTDSPKSRTAPRSQPLASATVPVLSQAESPANLPLNPPDFSLPAGSDKYKNFPKTLSLLPTNPSGTAAIAYSINGGPFIPYAGPITVAPNATVAALSMTLDPDRYDDSASASRAYEAVAMEPVASLTFPKSGYNYFELGGALHAGSPVPQPVSAASGAGGVSNLTEFPQSYQTSSLFRYVWSVDGTNPLQSATVRSQPDFTSGYVTAAIPLSITDFGTASSIQVNGAIKSNNADVMTDSPVVTQTLRAEMLTLRPPLVTIDGRDVTLAPDLSGGDTPANVRIYYTTDGSDPGVDSSGNPVRGTPWTGVPFTLDGTTGSGLNVIVRVYPPVAYKQFFDTSSPSTTTIVLPPATEVYVGGMFVNSTGNVMRNIAKLSNSGAVDPRFNTGTGASAESLVGVVRQVSGGVMAGGDFSSINGVARAGAVLLTPSGGVDPAFNAALSGN